jgi:hypothetical protein
METFRAEACSSNGLESTGKFRLFRSRINFSETPSRAIPQYRTPNFFLRKVTRGKESVRYVLSRAKFAMLRVSDILPLNIFAC